MPICNLQRRSAQTLCTATSQWNRLLKNAIGKIEEDLKLYIKYIYIQMPETFILFFLRTKNENKAEMFALG